MRNMHKTLAALVVGAPLLVASLLVAPLLAASPAGATTWSSVVGTAGNSFATVSVDAHNTGPGTSATGWFSATGNLTPTSPLGAFHFEGPVTCLDVEGNRAGLIYPITTATGPVASLAKGLAIYVTIQDNGPGQPTQVGFVGPAPLNDLTVCPPTVTFLTGTSGRVVIVDATP